MKLKRNDPDTVTITFEKADFSQAGLDKIKRIILREAGLDPTAANYVIEWPEPLMVATGVPPRYKVI